MQDYSKDLDSIDASVFSGEMLLVNFEEFKYYVSRWQRAIDEHEEAMEQDNDK